MRHLFYRFIVISVIFVAIVSYFWPPVLWAFIVIGPLIFVGIMNRLQKSHTILRNFPILGYFRYLFELISPEIQQYFIEKSTDGKPFSRNHRALVYRRAKNVNATHPFGTQLNINDENYEGIRHSIYATEPVKSQYWQ
jgi:hypothetical protein